MNKVIEWHLNLFSNSLHRFDEIQFYNHLSLQTICPESMNDDIDCIFEGLGDRGAIFISNSEAAKNLSLLQQLNINAVITAARGRYIHYPPESSPQYLYLQIDDFQTFPIDEFFDQSFQFIEKARKTTNVLIHCHVGASRSVTLAIAYLIRKYEYSLNQVFALIKRKRNKIKPNPGFVKVLEKFSQKYSLLTNDNEQTQKTPQKYFNFNLDSQTCGSSKQIITRRSASLRKEMSVSKREHSSKKRSTIAEKVSFLDSVETSKSRQAQESPEKAYEHQKEDNKNIEQLLKIKQERSNIEMKLQDLRKQIISTHKTPKSSGNNPSLRLRKKLSAQYQVLEPSSVSPRKNQINFRTTNENREHSSCQNSSNCGDSSPPILNSIKVSEFPNLSKLSAQTTASKEYALQNNGSCCSEDNQKTAVNNI